MTVFTLLPAVVLDFRAGFFFLFLFVQALFFLPALAFFAMGCYCFAVLLSRSAFSAVAAWRSFTAGTATAFLS